MDRLVADLDAGTPHYRQAARDRWHGPDRPSLGAPGARLRAVDPLPQQATCIARGGGGAGSDLLGLARPDAGPDGCGVGELPAYAGNIPSALRATAEAAQAARNRGEHGPWRDHRRKRA